MRRISGWKLVVTGVIVAIGVSFTPMDVHASGIIYQLDSEFSSGTPPFGAGPWVDVGFQDVSPGTVQLTVTNSALVSGEFVSQLYLNLNTNLNPNSLSFSYVSSTSGFTIPSQGAGTISTGVNAFKADGDGKYDVLFDFDTSGGSTFTVGDSITYLITGIGGLVASDFAYLSAPAGGHGPFYAAAYVQGIPPSGDSGWIEPSGGVTTIPVPEPSPIVIAGLSMCLLGCVRLLLNRTARN